MERISARASRSSAENSGMPSGRWLRRPPPRVRRTWSAAWRSSPRSMPPMAARHASHMTSWRCFGRRSTITSAPQAAHWHSMSWRPLLGRRPAVATGTMENPRRALERDQKVAASSTALGSMRACSSAARLGRSDDWLFCGCPPPEGRPRPRRFWLPCDWLKSVSGPVRAAFTCFRPVHALRSARLFKAGRGYGRWPRHQGGPSGGEGFRGRGRASYHDALHRTRTPVLPA